LFDRINPWKQDFLSPGEQLFFTILYIFMALVIVALPFIIYYASVEEAENKAKCEAKDGYYLARRHVSICLKKDSVINYND
jgi:hypothetical protein